MLVLGRCIPFLGRFPVPVVWVRVSRDLDDLERTMVLVEDHPVARGTTSVRCKRRDLGRWVGLEEIKRDAHRR